MTNDGSLATSLTWVARLVHDDAMVEARRLADTFGMVVLVEESTKLMLQLPSGDVIEYVTAEHPGASETFEGQDTVVGFQVADLDIAVAALAAAGFPQLSEALGDEHVRFQHVRGPGGAAYGLIQPI